MNTLNITLKEDYVIVQLNRGKVNAVNLEMVRDLNKAFQSFKKDDSVRGVILTGQPHFFTAGLDVIELYSYDKETIRAMFIEFGELF